MVLRNKATKAPGQQQRTACVVQCTDSRGVPELDRLKRCGDGLVLAAINLILEVELLQKRRNETHH